MRIHCPNNNMFLKNKIFLISKNLYGKLYTLPKFNYKFPLLPSTPAVPHPYSLSSSGIFDGF